MVILPPGLAPGCLSNINVGPYPTGAIGGPSNSDFPPPTMPMGLQSMSPHSGSYGYPGVQSYSAPPPPIYPNNPAVYGGPAGVQTSQPTHMFGSYNNPVPQVPSPYGTPFSSSLSSVLHPPPPPTPPPPRLFLSPPTRGMQEPHLELIRERAREKGVDGKRRSNGGGGGGEGRGVKKKKSRREQKARKNELW